MSLSAPTEGIKVTRRNIAIREGRLARERDQLVFLLSAEGKADLSDQEWGELIVECTERIEDIAGELVRAYQETKR